MDTSEAELNNLADPELVERLRCADWKDPRFVSDERVVQLFQAARATQNTIRVGLYSNELSRRMLRRAQAFALKNTLVPQHFSDLDEAAEAVSDYVWERLLIDKNAKFAARRFGVFFKNKSLSFFRALLAQRRLKTESLDWHQAVDADESDSDSDGEHRNEADVSLQDDGTPDRVLGDALEFKQVHARLRLLLTRNEYSTFVMLWRRQMRIKDIAAALGVTVRTINNYERSIKEQITKEFNYDFAQP